MTLMMHDEPTLFDLTAFEAPTPTRSGPSACRNPTRTRKPHTNPSSSERVKAWQPDDHLITAAQAGQLHIRNLTTEDRCWVVAGLTARGTTAEDIAGMLKCSLRLIKQIRAHPMTAVAHYAQTIAVEVETLAARERNARRAYAFELENMRMDADRYKKQRDDLIDQLAAQARKAERE